MRTNLGGEKCAWFVSLLITLQLCAQIWHGNVFVADHSLSPSVVGLVCVSLGLQGTITAIIEHVLNPIRWGW